MLASSVLFVVMTYPMFVFLTGIRPSDNLLLLQIVIGVPDDCLLCRHAGTGCTDIFPVQTRGTGMSLSYNIAVMIFGGFAGLIITWLIQSTGNKLAVSFFVIFGAVLSVIATLAARYRLKIR